jgi:hypothetical protein
MDYLENENYETYEICTCCIRGECMSEMFQDMQYFDEQDERTRSG